MIYLIRHGLDDERFIGGWSNTHLTPEGVKQSVNARNFIVNKGLVINNILSSDITRAKETADIINAKLEVPTFYSDHLREQNKGILNGVSKDIVEEYYSEYVNSKSIYKRFPEGESLSDLYHRVLYYIDEFLAKDKSLIVTHRGVINMLYYILNDIKLDCNKERFNVTHASIHELDTSLKKIKRIY